MSIGHSPNVEPHKPDMKKDEANITDKDRQDARRRIGGSMGTDADDMGIDMGITPENTDTMDTADLESRMSSLNPANVH